MNQWKRTMRLGLLLAEADHHPAGWRHASVRADGNIGFQHLARWAKVSEEGKLDFIFLGGEPVSMACNVKQGNAKLEPLTLAAALAAVTRHIGLVTTASTSLNHPFALARRLASIDHLSQGRAGWNLVRTATRDEMGNHSLDGSASRFDRAREFLAVVQGLFDGWEPGAFIRDRTTGVYMDPAKMHRLHHAGPHFKVRGPSDVDRPPQGALPIISEAASDDEQDFAAEVADMAFGGQPSIEDARIHYRSIKARLAYHGRTADSLHVMPTVMPMIGRTQAEAEDLFAILQGTISREAGHFGIVGTPTLVANTMEEWFTTGAADGFVVQPSYNSRGVEHFVHAVIPELQRRGLFRIDYEGATLRGNLGMTPVEAWQGVAVRSVRSPAL